MKAQVIIHIHFFLKKLMASMFVMSVNIINTNTVAGLILELP